MYDYIDFVYLPGTCDLHKISGTDLLFTGEGREKRKAI